MGHGGNLSCGKCGYSVELMFGVGMRSCGVFNLPLNEDKKDGLPAYIRSRAEYKIVKALLTEKHGVVENYGLGAYRCPRCRTFHNGFHYLIKHKGGKHEPVYTCKKCSSSLDYIGDDPDFSAYPCPKCGKPLLMMTTSIMWD